MANSISAMEQKLHLASVAETGREPTFRSESRRVYMSEKEEQKRLAWGMQ